LDCLPRLDEAATARLVIEAAAMQSQVQAQTQAAPTAETPKEADNGT